MRRTSQSNFASCVGRWRAITFTGWGIVALAPFTGLLAVDGRLISGSDYPSFFVPFHDFAREEVLAGRFPLWIPYLTCGAALHAEQHATLLYPLVAPFVMGFGANSGVKLAMFLHLALCYAGQYLLARRLTISRPAATFAAVAATWGMSAIDHLAAGHVRFVVGHALIPWFLWALLEVLAHPAAKSGAVLATVVTLFQLGSHPQVLYYALLAAACWTTGWLVSRHSTGRRIRALVWLLTAAAVTILLSGAQWLPALELVLDGSGQAERGKTAHAAMYSMDGSDLMRTVVPRFKGDELLGIASFDPDGYEHERGAYLGMLVLPLALYGLSRASAARWQWSSAWLCLLAAEIALADHSRLWEFFCAGLPGIVWFRCQGRIFSVVGIVAALLAARGLDALVRGEPAGGRRSRVALFGWMLSAGFVLGDAMRRWLARLDWHDYAAYAKSHLRDEYIDLAALTGVAALVWFLCRSFGRELPRLAYAAAIVFLMGDLYEYNVRHFQLVPPSGRWQVVLPTDARPTRFAFLLRDLGATRLSLQYSSAVPLAINSRVPSINTNDGAVLSSAVSRLFAAVERRPAPALALASCDWAFIESSQHWRKVTAALPRFRFIHAAAASLCERPIGDCTDDDVEVLRKGLGGTVAVRAEHPRLVEVDVEAPADGMFVLADSYYPGWHSTIDGQAAEIIRAHGVFRGVRLTAGKHRVEFVYDPLSFKVGCVMSGCGLAALATLVAFGWRQRRIEGPGGHADDRESDRI